MTTIIMNHSILTNEDLAQMAFEAVDANEMEGGLWAIHVDQYAMFDCSFMARAYKPGYHNAIVSVDIAPKPVASTQPDPSWLPSPEEIDQIEAMPEHEAGEAQDRPICPDCGCHH